VAALEVERQAGTQVLEQADTAVVAELDEVILFMSWGGEV
jgi:hypothetical protein